MTVYYEYNVVAASYIRVLDFAGSFFYNSINVEYTEHSVSSNASTDKLI